MTKQTIEEVTKLCFLQDKPCIHTHVHFLLTNESSYLAALQAICDSNVFLSSSQAIKARVIAALHITKHHKALQKVLSQSEVVEIVKAMSFLDRQRQIRQLERKIAQVEQAHPHLKEVDNCPDDHTDAATRPRKKRRKVDVFRAQLKSFQDQDEKDAKHKGDGCSVKAAHQNTAVQELIDSASVSGALARKIRQWAKQNLKADFLEFVVLADTMPTTAWKKLADLVHFHPSDFALPYFLSFVHGEPLPEGSFVHSLHGLIKEADTDVLATRFRALAAEHPQVYLAFNFLRTHPRLMGVGEIAADLAQNIPLSTAIWYLEEFALSSSEIPAMVGHRLKTEDWSKEHSKVTASFGKLLERVLTFQSRHWDSLAEDLVAAAEQRLAALKEVWSEEQKGTTTVVFGDASSSMTSAIQAATIMATMISACFGAELSFFASDYVASPYPRPSTVQQTLQICRTIRASGCTSLAAALWPYYEQKKKIDRIILVTDEEENTPCRGFNFARLLQKYMNEIHKNVELIVICVDSGDVRFRASLAECGIACKVMKIDGRRPDLTKFDAMLGQIALDTSKTEEEEFVVV